MTKRIKRLKPPIRYTARHFWGSSVCIHFGFFGLRTHEDSDKIAMDIEAKMSRKDTLVMFDVVLTYPDVICCSSRRIVSLKICTTLVHLIFPKLACLVSYYNIQAIIPQDKFSSWWLHCNKHNILNCSIPYLWTIHSSQSMQ